jgi:sugar phosphate isomerase/epimerase
VIFVSSSCVKNKKIKDSVEELANAGFKNIELSGGTDFYENFENDLLELKDKYSLNYRCHNYFPPPKKPFVLNLASLNDETFQMSFDHLEKVVALSNRLGADKFAFHAGFFIDIKLNEIGKKLSRDSLFDEVESINRFCNAFKLLQKKAEENGISLYIENNVFSKTNAETYSEENPFMMTNFNEYKILKEKIDFNLLLDVAHLKVSAKTLNLNWRDEFENMINASNYIHISDNDGLHDLNNQVRRSSDLWSMLSNSDTTNKDFTLEIYDGMSSIKSSYKSLESAIL